MFEQSVLQCDLSRAQSKATLSPNELRTGLVPVHHGGVDRDPQPSQREGLLTLNNALSYVQSPKNKLDLTEPFRSADLSDTHL